jgi:uncharacterized protein YgbK (DUF1537 family)
MTETLLDRLPPEFPDDTIAEQVRTAVAASGRKVVALDDDPTGVQTVHDTPVLASWSIPDLAEVLREPGPLVFVLTNSRSLPSEDAVRLNEEIVGNLVAASRQTRVDFAVASRSDSTLRGHFPAETDAIASVLGGVDGVLIVPAFFEGGRYTIDDVHWVRDGDRLIPAAETEFARDATFGYTNSDLKAWVAEKSGGRIPASSVASLSIDVIRRGGPEGVAARLAEIGGGQPVIVNAASYRDLDVVVLGLLQAEAAGQRFVYRTGASFVRARAGIAERPLLTRQELLGAEAPIPLPGLVVVGSHVQRTTEQLARLLALPGVVPIEVRVPVLLDSDASRERVVATARQEADRVLARGDVPVVVTSREAIGAGDPLRQLEISRTVSAALVDIVRGVEGRPGWVIGKGGITSSDIGTKALGARRATVLGQLRPGIPVWRLGRETRYPGLPYVVFPGNVGGPETLAEAVTLLRGERGDRTATDETHLA